MSDFPHEDDEKFEKKGDAVITVILVLFAIAVIGLVFIAPVVVSLR